MKIDFDFSALDQAAKKIGAVNKDWSLPPYILPPISIGLEKGIEVPISDIVTTGSGVLSYQDQHVLLYIMAQGNFAWKAFSPEGGGYRFHVADCDTLKKMRSIKRLERYVATNKTTGKFRITGRDKENKNDIDKEGKLLVCQKCMKLLNYKEFRKLPSGAPRRKFVQDFDLNLFFASYRSCFEYMPSRRDNAPVENYVSNWPDISKKYRTSKKWICEQCQVDLKDYSNLLHVHHINGVKNDNKYINFKALCIDCHSRQPQHHHMRVAREKRLLINKLRNKMPKQHIGISSKANWDEIFSSADPALYGLLSLCQSKNMLLPEIGYEFIVNNKVVALDLAWIYLKKAVTLRPNNDETELMSEHGWTVYSLAKAMKQLP